MSQSWLPISTILKTALKVLEKPKYAKNVAMIQVDKFLRNLSPRADKGTAKRIRQCSIRITDICNLRCHTCGQWGDRGFLRSCSLPELKSKEVSTERYLELIQDLYKHGHTPSVYLWGGEPMLYKGSVEIIEEAARLGMAPSIATNGTGLVKNAERLVNAPMFIIQISVDGPDAETHNASRPGAGADVDNFDTISKAIDAFNAAKAKAAAEARLLPKTPPKGAVRRDVIKDAVQPKGDSSTPSPANSEAAAFDEGYKRG